MRTCLLVAAAALLGALTSAAPPLASTTPPVATPTVGVAFAEPTTRTAVEPVAVSRHTVLLSEFRYSIDVTVDEAVLCYTVFAGAARPGVPAASTTVGQNWPAPLLIIAQLRPAIQFKRPPCSYHPALLTYLTT